MRHDPGCATKMRQEFTMSTVEQGTGDRRKRRTRQALEHALLELIAAQSYEAITIQQITDRANVGRATFYLHFDGKEQLVLATLEGLTSDLTQRLPSPTGQDLLAGNRALLIALFQHVADYRRLYRALLGEHGPALVVWRLHDYLAEQIEQHVVTPLLDASRDGAIPLVPPTFLTAYLSGAMLAAVRWWVERDCQETPDEMALLAQRANRPTLLQALGFTAERRT
jgi:AcrR family transcriptional regulator